MKSLFFFFFFFAFFFFFFSKTTWKSSAQFSQQIVKAGLGDISPTLIPLDAIGQFRSMIWLTNLLFSDCCSWFSVSLTSSDSEKVTVVTRISFPFPSYGRMKQRCWNNERKIDEQHTCKSRLMTTEILSNCCRGARYVCMVDWQVVVLWLVPWTAHYEWCTIKQNPAHWHPKLISEWIVSYHFDQSLDCNRFACKFCFLFNGIASEQQSNRACVREWLALAVTCTCCLKREKQ